MQTFLPIPSFKESAKSLDRQRLGKQRLEAIQLIRITHKILTKQPVNGWANHPARLMWSSNPGSLAVYGCEICKEWIARGYKDTLLQEFVHWKTVFPDSSMPSWFGDEKFHLSHRANLLRKGQEKLIKTGKDDILLWYKNQWPDIIDYSLPYVWPK